MRGTAGKKVSIGSIALAKSCCVFTGQSWFETCDPIQCDKHASHNRKYNVGITHVPKYVQARHGHNKQEAGNPLWSLRACQRDSMTQHQYLSVTTCQHVSVAHISMRTCHHDVREERGSLIFVAKVAQLVRAVRIPSCFLDKVKHLVQECYRREVCGALFL